VTAPRVDDALLVALTALNAWLRASRVPYAVIGGVAVGLQAIPRATRDVDAVIVTADDRWGPLLDAAAAFGITPRIADPLAFAARTRVLLLRHDSGVPLDLSCGALPFEEELVAAADTMHVGAEEFPVATPLHLVVLKAVANRPQDRADIDALLRVHPTLDVAAARRVLAEFADVLEAPELLTDFDAAVRRQG
jgi:hypothetical protein